MKVDNFKAYEDFLRDNGIPETINYNRNFTPKYYVIEVMRRGKDNPNLSAVNVHFKNYYIQSIEELHKAMPEIILLCDVMRMRAYGSVNIKDGKQVMINTAQELIRRVGCSDFRRPWKIFNSCSGKYLERDDKKWVIDIDDCVKDGEIIDMDKIERYKSVIFQCSPSYNENVLTHFKTRTGIHLITKPFNRWEYDKKIDEMGLDIEKAKKVVHMNHLTLVYCYSE